MELTERGTEMKTQWLWVGSLSLALLVVVGCKKKEKAEQAEQAEKTAVSAKVQTTCPHMGEKIDKSIYVDHEGKRVYFCCKMCVAKFKADPGKYVKKLEDEGVELEKTPPAQP